ncbi:MAG: SDR family NAD(P)-dependent oxidoreductase [Micrococcales bacterium]|nr:SDR family NAD(P)-dependent oxidoreductase [Micrococcales bacterium]
MPESIHETGAADRRAPTPQTALVAGGSRGLGLLIAAELALRGYRVQVCGRDPRTLQQARDQLARERLSIGTTVCDVSDSAAVAAWVRAASDPSAPITVAIHVAGIIQVGPIESVTPAMFDECIDIMTKGPAYLALAVLPGMRARGFGRYGIVSSVGGVIGVPHLVPYSTAKFGAAGLGQALRAELAGTGVTATTILPPPMRTGSHVHAQYSGNRSAEYAWFAPGASIPGVSLDGRTAARRAVDGTLRGAPIVGLSPVTQLLMRAHGLAPSTVVRALGVLGRVLPGGTGRPKAGHDVRDERTNPLVDALTTAGDAMGARTNEQHRVEGDPAP